MRAKSINERLLYSAHQTIWNSVGLTSFFGGALIESLNLNEKQVVPTASGVAVHVPCQNLVVHPKAAIFMDASSKAKTITVQQAITMMQKTDARVSAQSVEKVLQVWCLRLVLTGALNILCRNLKPNSMLFRTRLRLIPFWDENKIRHKAAECEFPFDLHALLAILLFFYFRHTIMQCLLDFLWRLLRQI